MDAVHLLGEPTTPVARSWIELAAGHSVGETFGMQEIKRPAVSTIERDVQLGAWLLSCLHSVMTSQRGGYSWGGGTLTSLDSLQVVRSLCGETGCIRKMSVPHTATDRRRWCMGNRVVGSAVRSGK